MANERMKAAKYGRLCARPSVCGSCWRNMMNENGMALIINQSAA